MPILPEVLIKHSKCEHLIAPLFTVGTAEIYAGSASDYEYVARSSGDKLGVTLCLNSSSVYKSDILHIRKATIEHGLEAYTTATYPGECYFSIDWTDRSDVNLGKEFWTDWMAFIQNECQGKSVFLHCVGGHGRTGTALSIMAGLAGANGDKDPVAWLREVYCHEAVESTIQVEYIETILDITCPKDTIQPFTMANGGGYKGTGFQGGYGNQPTYYSNQYPGYHTPPVQQNDQPAAQPLMAASTDTWGQIPKDKTSKKTMKRLIHEIKELDKAALNGDKVAREHSADQKVYWVGNNVGYRAAWGTPIHRTFTTAQAMLTQAFYEVDVRLADTGV
jgi:hypothetical protein